MDPINLQRQIRNNSSDVLNFCEELKQWGEEMKRKDESLKTGSETTNINVPLPRSKSKKKSDPSKPIPEKPKTKTAKLPKSYDDWEKFDVDAACAKVDESDDSGGELTDEFDESAREEAIYEKEKGNKFVKKQKWDEAIECYTKAIECFAYDPIFYANRALCYLKKLNYRAAESDCTSALQLDKTYVKAYQRRAAAREALNQLTEAHADLLKVFDYESNNKESKAALAKLEKRLETFNKEACVKKADVQRPKSKFTISRQQQKDKAHSSQAQALASTSKAESVTDSSVKSEANANKSANLNLPKFATYWPSGNEVELIQAVLKPPHLRSKKPLKRVTIQDIDTLSSDTGTKVESENAKVEETVQPWPRPENNSLTIKPAEFKVVERIEDGNRPEKKDFNEKRKESKFAKEKINSKIISDTNKHVAEDVKDVETKEFKLSVPQTSVQFNIDWRLLAHEPDLRYHYLKQVKPERLALIFKESLDCDIFSGIIHTLADTFIEKGGPVYEYLSGLCEVKRFSMLAMFMSEDDKKAMVELADYMRSDSSLSNVNIDNLLSKYGL